MWHSSLLTQLQNRNKVETQVSTLGACYTELLKQHNKSRGEQSSLSTQLEKERDTVATLKSDLAVMEQRYAPSKQNARILELEGLNKALQQQLQQGYDATQRLIKLQDSEAILKTNVAKLESLVATLQTKGEGLEKTVQQLSTELTETKKSEEILRVERQSLLDKYDLISKDSTRLTEEVIKAKNNNAELMNQHFNMETQIQQLMQEIEKLKSSPVSGGTGGAGNASFNQATFSHAPAGFLDDMTLRSSGFASVPLGRKVQDLDSAHDGEINVCHFARDKLVTGGADKVVKVWDATSGHLSASFNVTGSVLSIAEACDNLVVGCADSVARVFVLSTQRAKCQLTGHTDGVTAVAITPDGKTAFTASKDRTFKQWDVKERGGATWTRPCFSLCHDVTVTCDQVMTAHFDAAIRLWDRRQGNVIQEIKGAHGQALTCTRFNPSDPTRFLSLGRDNTLKLWDTRRYEAYATLTSPDLIVPSNFCRANWSHCGTYVIVGGTNHVLVYAGHKQQDHPSTVLRNGHKGLVSCVSWSEDGQLVGSVGHDRRIIIWN